MGDASACGRERYCKFKDETGECKFRQKKWKNDHPGGLIEEEEEENGPASRCIGLDASACGRERYCKFKDETGECKFRQKKWKNDHPGGLIEEEEEENGP